MVYYIVDDTGSRPDARVARSTAMSAPEACGRATAQGRALPSVTDVAGHDQVVVHFDNLTVELLVTCKLDNFTCFKALSGHVHDIVIFDSEIPRYVSMLKLYYASLSSPLCLRS